MADTTAKGKERIVLVFDGNVLHDWVTLFRGKELSDGSTLRVVQTSWMDTAVTSYTDSGMMFGCAPVRDSHSDTKRPNRLQVHAPALAIVRNQPRGPTPISDNRHTLFGLMHAGLPAINSLHSIYMNLERPIMFGELLKIKRKHGADAFPLIDQNYYSHYGQMVISPDLPAIVKVSHAHAGKGKIRVESGDAFRDVSTILAVTDQYCTAEKYITPEVGIRVQRVGRKTRVLLKHFTGAGWKSQFGGAALKEVEGELEERYQRWADLVSAEAFNGEMDLFAIDAIRDADGREYIIELNGTAIGIQSETWHEDSKEIVRLALAKLELEYCTADETAATTPAEAGAPA